MMATARDIDAKVKRNLLILLTLGLAINSFAQTRNDEQQILSFHRSMDAAMVSGDLAVFEGLLAADYIYSNNFGKTFTREENLAYLKELFQGGDFKIIANRSDNIKVRVKGTTALLTADWTTTGLQKDDSNAEPHVDKGRFTSYYEKRDGRWFVVSEHSSERQHDVKVMERQVAALGRKYSEMIQRNDEAAIRKILADNYLLTDETGKTFTKEQDLATYKNRARELKIDKIEYLDQKIQVISNNAAIDHSTIRFIGTRIGKAFDITEKCTTVWSFNNGRWQIVSDHFSYITPSKSN